MTRLIIPALVALLFGWPESAEAKTTYFICPVLNEYRDSGLADLMYKFDNPLLGSSTLTMISEGKTYLKIIEMHDDVIHFWHTENQKLNYPEFYDWLNLVTGEVGRNSPPIKPENITPGKPEFTFKSVHSKRCEKRQG